MSDPDQSVTFVTIGGKKYSRLMAEQAALDIEMVHAIRPGAWAIGESATLVIGSAVVLDFALPLQHGYLIDAEDATDDVLQIVEILGIDAGLRSFPTLSRINLPEDDLGNMLRRLRSAHDAAVRKTSTWFHLCHRWKSHNFEVAEILGRIVSRDLPEPSYAQELKELRVGDAQVGEPSQITSNIADLNLSMLAVIAQDIEIAHETNPNSWAFYRTKQGGAVLIVGAIYASYAFKNRGSLVLPGDPSDQRFGSIDPSHIPQGFDSFPGFLANTNSVEEFEFISKEFAAQHRDAIVDLASRVKTRSQRANEHQPKTLESLSRLVGRELPNPAYLAEKRDGEIKVPSLRKRYWKISPGEGGKDWPYFRDRSFIAMELGDNRVDLSEFPDDQIAFTTRVRSELEISGQGAKSLWDFARIIQPGDDILAYARQTVLGYGIVRGAYQFVEDDFPYLHRREVTWTSLEPHSILPLSSELQARLKTVATLVELSEEQFMQATGQRNVAFDPLTAMLEQFAASGLHYTLNQIATFYTALQTKGFVVLTGISGTGKSKIATGFVEMLPAPAETAAPRRDSYGFMPIVVKRYMKESRRIVIPVRYYELLTPMERGASYQLPVSINGKAGTGRLWFRIHGGRDQYLLSFHQILSPEINAWIEGQHIYLDIALNSEGDKVLEVRITNDPPALDASEAASPELAVGAKNHLFLSVRPDWRDSTSLLGYYNPLTQTYEWTEFLRFVLRAQASFRAKDGLAWFVILDEMNLAHVEYYFADLLSVVESGRDADGWTRESVRLSYPDLLDDDAPPQELRLPPNLYIIGTVNMDETTHAFSPKVLDRAFTIELSEVDFLTYQLASKPGQSQYGDLQKRQLLSAFTRTDIVTGSPEFARIDKREIAAILEAEPDIRRFLDALNKLLQDSRFHFGYRVFDEIAQYLYNNRRNGMMDFIPAFDQAVFMKVLPKFSGSRARVRSPLLALLTWTLHPDNPAQAFKTVQQNFAALDLEDGDALARFTRDATFVAVARRSLQMLAALESDGFVSFG